MQRFEIDFVPDAGSWGVFDDQDVPLTAEDTKRAAKQFAKRHVSPGDTIVQYNRDGSFDEEYLVDEDGEWVAADAGSHTDQNYGGELFGAGGSGGGGGGLFGGW